MSEWISIEKQEPPSNERVLVKTECNTVGFGKYHPNDKYSAWSLWCCVGTPVFWMHYPR